MTISLILEVLLRRFFDVNVNVMDVHSELKRRDRDPAKNAGECRRFISLVLFSSLPGLQSPPCLTRQGLAGLTERTETGRSTVVDVPHSSYKSKLKSGLTMGETSACCKKVRSISVPAAIPTTA
ncbi:MAG: hypothetical protein ACOVO5_08420 [Devosia sp.]|nr:hypothetical protein [Rhizobium sp.]MCZ8350147.1 hypothetical protein [Rhizobium sp.]